eukprot:TRINITY_DN102658_c0_g1_i1.p1 TRINITY_DN102658_c0_g1~~TRINITY_DN102658_c0_g1_i1.p1  ORF type:complete len:535 (+),score=96.36 TRINITY_DN102658_c0_g1_i1:67-1671(+)
MCDDPRLTVAGAVYNSQGDLDVSAYADLVDKFSDDASSQPEDSGVEDDGLLLRLSKQPKDRGWVAKHPSRRVQWGYFDRKFFRTAKWKSWRLTFLLATLQREVWQTVPDCSRREDGGAASARGSTPAGRSGRRRSPETPRKLSHAEVRQQPEKMVTASVTDATGKTLREQDLANLAFSKLVNSDIGSLVLRPAGQRDAGAAGSSAAVCATPLKRRRLSSKTAAPARSAAACYSEAFLQVFSQVDPLFGIWLQPASEGAAAAALNPSPFDLYALLCASRLFSHLGAPLAAERDRPLAGRCSVRLRGKQFGGSTATATERRRTTLMQKVWRDFAESSRGKYCSAVAFHDGDLDALRFHVEVRGHGMPDVDLLMSVINRQSTLVSWILHRRSSTSSEYFDVQAKLLHEAIAVWMRGAEQSRKPDMKPLANVIALAQAGADINEPFLVSAPLPGMGRKGEELNARLLDLPFMRRGDSPLAWAMRCLGETTSTTSPTVQRARLLVPLLLWLGADWTTLPRRQQRSLVHILQTVEGEAVA